MEKKRFITLLTDFGDQDSYLAELKGVILSINPEAEIVEAGHKVEAGNIRQGAYLLGRYFKYYPEGTIHLTVVDPGVGSKRLPILLETEEYSFVGPDNGLFSYVLEAEKEKLAVKLTNGKYQLASPFRTFDGRDIFAPTAAYLSLGVDPREFGPELDRLETFEITKPEVKGNRIEGEIVHIDHFGNAVTNIPLVLLNDVGRFSCVKVKEKTIDKLVKSYQQGRDYDLFAIVGSGGTLEISSYGEEASKRLEVSIGDKVCLETKKR